MTTNSVSWNATSGSGLHTMMRAIQTRSNPNNSDLAIYGQNVVTGNLPASQSLDGIAGEVDTTGAIVTNPNLNLGGVEGSVVLGSTGGTIANAYGGIFNIAAASGNTTNLTNAASVYAQGVSNNSTGTIANAYGVYAPQQTAGTARNYAFYGVGRWLLGHASGGTAIDAEDSTNVPRPFLAIDNGNHTMITAISPAGLFLQDSTPTNQMRISNSGVTISKSVMNDAGGFKHKRFGATCVTAVSAGATCGKAYTWTTPFADANYTVTCTLLGAVNVPTIVGIESKASAGFTLKIATITAAAASAGEVDCIAVHD
jgi:hypothetical protein